MTRQQPDNKRIVKETTEPLTVSDTDNEANVAYEPSTDVRFEIGSHYEQQDAQRFISENVNNENNENITCIFTDKLLTTQRLAQGHTATTSLIRGTH